MNTTQSEFRITPFLWFTGSAKAALCLYSEVFNSARIVHLDNWGSGSPYPEHYLARGVVQLPGVELLAMDAHQHHSLNSSISLFIEFPTRRGVQEAWNRLIDRGKVIMPLQVYPWSPLYGWLEDRYGVTWQIMLAEQMENPSPRVSPCLLFTGLNRGKAHEAIDFYTALFPNSGICRIENTNEVGGDSFVAHAAFTLGGESFMAMDATADTPATPFNDAFSFMVHCKDQMQIDYLWDGLIAQGGKAVQCGWLVDRFGVSWQIIPEALSRLIHESGDAERKRVSDALMGMVKLDVAELERAYRG